jgi:hypothetical protein
MLTAGTRQITQSLNSIVRLSGEVETGIVLVERVLEYARLSSEAPDVFITTALPLAGPRTGLSSTSITARVIGQA